VKIYHQSLACPLLPSPPWSVLIPCYCSAPHLSLTQPSSSHTQRYPLVIALGVWLVPSVLTCRCFCFLHCVSYPGRHHSGCALQATCTWCTKLQSWTYLEIQSLWFVIEWLGGHWKAFFWTIILLYHWLHGNSDTPYVSIIPAVSGVDLHLYGLLWINNLNLSIIHTLHILFSSHLLSQLYWDSVAVGSWHLFGISYRVLSALVVRGHW